MEAHNFFNIISPLTIKLKALFHFPFYTSRLSLISFLAKHACNYKQILKSANYLLRRNQSIIALKSGAPATYDRATLLSPHRLSNFTSETKPPNSEICVSIFRRNQAEHRLQIPATHQPVLASQSSQILNPQKRSLPSLILPSDNSEQPTPPPASPTLSRTAALLPHLSPSASSSLAESGSVTLLPRASLSPTAAPQPPTQCRTTNGLDSRCRRRPSFSRLVRTAAARQTTAALPCSRPTLLSISYFSTQHTTISNIYNSFSYDYTFNVPSS